MRTKPALTSADAHKMMAACKAEAQKQKWNVTIAIVDDAGYPLLVERMDGCGPISAEVAVGKARTAAITRRPTKFWEDRIKERPAFLTFPSQGQMFQGGLPLKTLSQRAGGRCPQSHPALQQELWPYLNQCSSGDILGVGGGGGLVGGAARRLISARNASSGIFPRST